MLMYQSFAEKWYKRKDIFSNSEAQENDAKKLQKEEEEIKSLSLIKIVI